MSDQEPVPFDNDRSPLVIMRDLMVQAFNLDELKKLCSDLGVDYEEVDGETKTTKIISLINLAKRRKSLHQLWQVVGKARPEYELPTLAALESDSSFLTIDSPDVLPKRRGCYAELGKLKIYLILATVLFVLGMPLATVLLFNNVMSFGNGDTPTPTMAAPTPTLTVTPSSTSTFTQSPTRFPTETLTPLSISNLTLTPTSTLLPLATPTEVPLPLTCVNRAIIPSIFSPFQFSSNKNLFYGSVGEPGFLCQGVYDIVHSPPLAVFLQFQYSDENYGYWGLSFSDSLDVTSYNEVCVWAYTESISQVFWFQLRDLQETLAEVDIVIDQSGQWAEHCIPLSLFSEKNVILSEISNFTILLDNRSSSSTIWLDDFEFR